MRPFFAESEGIRTMKLNQFATMAEQFDGTGPVFNPETNAAMSLNKTGVFLWRELENGADEPALVRALLDHFSGVTGEQATRDVQAFVEALRTRSLLSEQ